jgi:hypothetical protein
LTIAGVSIEELIAARAEGLSWPEMTVRFGVGERNMRKRVQHYHMTRPVPPAAADVPDGFEISNISTTRNKHGNVINQSVQSKPESLDDSELVPAGHLVKGYSTLTDARGRITARWTKTRLDEKQWLEMVNGACEAAASRIKPLKRIAAPATRSLMQQLAVLYTMTDCHVGMLAWGRETGAPWDLSIAETCLTSTLFEMIDAAPAAEVGILNQLGDFLHFDSLKSITPEHGHLLDADGRYQKVVEIAVRILRQVITRMLTKHGRVRVYMHEGNHDPAGSVWLRVMFAQLFSGNPRVTVERSPLPYVVYQHGKTLLAFHHGHLAKKEQLPLLFAAKYPAEWGATAKRYVHTGHMHHSDEKEHPGMKVIQHPTLAAPDAYAARGGWLSERQVMYITYHKERGEIARGTFLPAE